MKAGAEGGASSGKSSSRRSYQTAVFPFDIAEALPAENVRLQRMPFCLQRISEIEMSYGVKANPSSNNSPFYHGFRYEQEINNFEINLLDEKLVIKYPYLKDVIFQKVYSQNEINNSYAFPGEFTGTLYAADQSSNSVKSAKEVLNENGMAFRTIKEIKSIWQAAIGVYLFRNDFRLLPYGPDYEWLDFHRRSTRAKNNIYKSHTVSGYVNLDGETSENLQEQTNRQGLIMDEYGSNFINIVKNVVAEIAFQVDTRLRKGFEVENFTEHDDEVQTKDKNIIFNRIASPVERKKELIESVIEDTSEVERQTNYNNINNYYNNIHDKLAKIKDEYEKEEKKSKQERFKFEQEIAQLKSLVGLAGQGIIVEALTHELNRIEKNITSYAKDTKRLINGNNSYSLDEVLKNQDRILQEVLFLQSQLDHLEPTYRKNSMVLDHIEVKSFLAEMYRGKTPMSEKAKNSGVDILLNGDDFNIKSNKGVLVTIFDNFILNSLYWLNESNTKKKQIYFNFNSIEGEIVVWDTGPGFHREIEKDIFEPYESMKPEGRGLGLYIVSELIKSLNGAIDLLDEKNKHGNKYKLIISFNNVE